MTGQHVRSSILALRGCTVGASPDAAGRMLPIIVSLIAAAAILLCEAVTPLPVSVGCLYMILATYAAMRFAEAEVIVLLGATMIGGVIAHHLQPFSGIAVLPGLSGIEIWNGLTRIVTVCLYGVVLRRLLLALRGERQRAERDPLTGAFNRRALYERFAIIAARRTTVGIVFVDLDAFKCANDRFGHAAGDALLARLAFSATAGLGDDDLFARLGGDEFVAVLVGADEEGVEQRVHGLHARLARTLRETELGVTCSIGAVVARIQRNEQLDALIMRADRLMYEVKDAGKDGLRVVCRGPNEPVAVLTLPQGRRPRVRVGTVLRRRA